MPNLDTGHYFLTTFAPVKIGTTTDDNGVKVSYEQRLRLMLSVLPTALQSPATLKIGINSPFARNTRNHFCRFMLMGDVIYNGRDGQDPIITSIKKENPVDPQHVDKLTTPYLMFVSDFDAVKTGGNPLPATLSESEQDAVRDAYARKLWDTMEPELLLLYENCVGFDDVTDAAGFARYLAKCQVETTMPFNDYWLETPAFNNLPVVPLLAGVGLPLLVGVISGICWLTGWNPLPMLGWSAGWTSIVGLALFVLAVCVAIKFALNNGQKSLPPGKYADLPSVLKGLYLQQYFSNFVTDNQGKPAQELHASFGEFLKMHQPENNTSPSQPPGVLSHKHSMADTRTEGEK